MLLLACETLNKVRSVRHLLALHVRVISTVGPGRTAEADRVLEGFLKLHACTFALLCARGPGQVYSFQRRW